MEVASTALMDEVCGAPFRPVGRPVLRVPRVTMFLDGLRPGRHPILDADYWAANVRRPVRSAGGRCGRRRPRHLHRISPTRSDPLDRRHAQRRAPPRAAHPGSRRGRHVHLPHQSQRHPTNHPRSPPHPPDPMSRCRRRRVAAPAPLGARTAAALVRRAHRPAGRPGASVIPANGSAEMHWPASPLGEEAAAAGGHSWLVIAGSRDRRRIAAPTRRRCRDRRRARGTGRRSRCGDRRTLGVTDVLYAPEGSGPGAASWEPAAGRRFSPPRADWPSRWPTAHCLRR